MSDRRRDRDKKSRAARGATLFSGMKRDKRKKRSRNTEKTTKKRIIYNRADDPEFEKKLINYLGKNGIEVASYKDRYILRRLRVRMGRLKLTSYKDYLDYIRKHPTELGEIQESLSINVTRFFRNRDTYESVRDDVLPLLGKKKKNIKIWSAGCAVGAEPYSIAMIASDAVPKSTKVSVMATDVKNELLNTARFGVYSKPYLAEMKTTEINRYFIETGAEDYKVKPHIKSMVNFRQQDLMKDDFPRNIDMVFCRNVLIYVDREAQNVILNKFFKALNPGGFLVLGRTETLFGDWRKSVDIISTKHRIYRKKEIGNFNEIKMTDPVADLVGDTFPRLKDRKPKTTKSARNRIRKTSTTTASERLQELRDFRKTFEERKKRWEERMEQNRIKREARNQSTTRKTTSSFRDRSSRRSTTQTNNRSDSIFSSRRDRKDVDKNESTSLSDYRKRLKRSGSNIRESKVRRDLE